MGSKVCRSCSRSWATSRSGRSAGSATRTTGRRARAGRSRWFVTVGVHLGLRAGRRRVLPGKLPSDPGVVVVTTAFLICGLLAGGVWRSRSPHCSTPGGLNAPTSPDVTDSDLAAPRRDDDRDASGRRAAVSTDAIVARLSGGRFAVDLACVAEVGSRPGRHPGARPAQLACRRRELAWPDPAGAGHQRPCSVPTPRPLTIGRGCWCSPKARSSSACLSTPSRAPRCSTRRRRVPAGQRADRRRSAQRAGRRATTARIAVLDVAAVMRLRDSLPRGRRTA